VARTLGSRRFRRRAIDAATTVVLLAGLAYVLLPLTWLASTSLKIPVDAFASPPKILSTPTLENFQSLFAGPFLGYLANSVIITTLATAVALAFGVPAAYALDRGRFRGRHLIMNWMLITYIVPITVYVLPLFLMYLRVGLINTYAGLTLAYETILLPFTVWMMTSYFRHIPTDLDEAALVDGCSRFEAFIRVIVPVAVPGIATVGLLVALTAWAEYFATLILSGQDTLTATVGVYAFVGTQSHNWSQMAAAAVMVAMPALIATVVSQRGLMAGLTAGAVRH